MKYILQAARSMFPAIDSYRMSRTYVGIRPTLYTWSKNEDRLSREHEIYDHASQGVPGLISVAGGKLAAYRQLAEEVTDSIGLRVGNRKSCSTHTAMLPGAEGNVDVEGWVASHQAKRLTVSRMAYRHGSRTESILRTIDTDPRLGVAVCPCEPVCEAEVRYTCCHELVRKLTDVRRRTRLSMGACGGTRCLYRASQILADSGALPEPEQLVEFHGAMTARFIGKRPVLEGANLATEELNQGIHFLTAHLGPALRAAREEVGVGRSVPLSAPADAPLVRSQSATKADVLTPPSGSHG